MLASCQEADHFSVGGGLCLTEANVAATRPLTGCDGGGGLSGGALFVARVWVRSSSYFTHVIWQTFRRATGVVSDPCCQHRNASDASFSQQHRVAGLQFCTSTTTDNHSIIS